MISWSDVISDYYKSKTSATYGKIIEVTDLERVIIDDDRSKIMLCDRFIFCVNLC